MPLFRYSQFTRPAGDAEESGYRNVQRLAQCGNDVDVGPGSAGLPVAYKIPGKAERLGKLGLADAATLPPGADDISIHLLVERMEFLFLMTGKTDDIVFPVRILRRFHSTTSQSWSRL